MLPYRHAVLHLRHVTARKDVRIVGLHSTVGANRTTNAQFESGSSCQIRFRLHAVSQREIELIITGHWFT